MVTSKVSDTSFSSTSTSSPVSCSTTTTSSSMDSIVLLVAGVPVLPSVSSSSSVMVPVKKIPTFSSSLRKGFGCRSQLVSRPSASTSGSAVASGDGAAPSGISTVGDFMTRKEDLLVLNPNTLVDKALEMLVEYNVSGFPVVDEDWKLVGVVSDYDLLAVESVSGNGGEETSLFPDVDSTWKTFYQVQKLINKNHGKFTSDVMTEFPLVLHKSSNLKEAARLFLETKFHRLPVVDSGGKLVGMISRGDVVEAAVQSKLSGH